LEAQKRESIKLCSEEAAGLQLQFSKNNGANIIRNVAELPPQQQRREH
jgi:hypothetical protein